MVGRKHKIWPQKFFVLTSAVVLAFASLGLRMSDLTAGETGQLRSVSDGDTLYLDSGLKVRLAAIQAPKLPLGREGFKAWPLGEESKAALEKLTKGKTLQLFYGGERRDRYDRALAQVYSLDGEGAKNIWLQEEMVRLGMARVYTGRIRSKTLKNFMRPKLRREMQNGGFGGRIITVFAAPSLMRLRKILTAIKLSKVL